MKKFFPGYYPLTPDETHAVWNESLIVVDTAFLLSLFCMNRNYADMILSILGKDKIKEKLWLPYDVVWHYHKSLNNVILDQISQVKRMQVLMRESLSLVSNECLHPHLSSDISSSFKTVCEGVNENCEELIRSLKNSLYESELKNKINLLFDGKIGVPYNKAELAELYGQAQDRYEKQIPPGYTTDCYTDQRLRYHDFIVWEQLKKVAKDRRKNIVYCTTREKEDWFYMVDGEVVTSNSFLVNDFKESVDQSFKCYSFRTFLNECKALGIVSPEESQLFPETFKLRFDYSMSDSTSTSSNTI